MVGLAIRAGPRLLRLGQFLQIEFAGLAELAQGLLALGGRCGDNHRSGIAGLRAGGFDVLDELIGAADQILGVGAAHGNGLVTVPEIERRGMRDLPSFPAVTSPQYTVSV